MQVYNNRLEKWKEPVRFPCTYFPEEESLLSNFLDLHFKGNMGNEDNRIFFDDLIGSSKELIFDIRDGLPCFICINVSLDTKTFELVYSKGWITIPDKNKSEEEQNKSVISTLARASMYDVPVYPNTSDLEPLLADYYEELVLNGFVVEDEDGREVRLINTYSPKEKIKDITYLLNRDSSIQVSPAELAIIKKVATETFTKLSRAQYVLSSLTTAISKFTEILDQDDRNERVIQKCLLENPVLFGLEYLKVLPEHKLGSEYIIDYALEKIAGNFDVVELEASNLKLYNKNGNPSSHLVHAEQQVLDWLEWIETNSPYAGNILPGISSPKGFVIIGRTSDLTESDKIRLKRRNLTFGDRLNVWTYDELLNRAKNTLLVLEKER